MALQCRQPGYTPARPSFAYSGGRASPHLATNQPQLPALPTNQRRIHPVRDCYHILTRGYNPESPPHKTPGCARQYIGGRLNWQRSQQFSRMANWLPANMTAISLDEFNFSLAGFTQTIPGFTATGTHRWVDPIQ
jgi:hypothetical protein